MSVYCSTIVNVKEKNIIYNSFMHDCKRAVISRRRLSNHKFRVETGRYARPPIPREICINCDILENEFHVVFQCPIFHHIRLKYRGLLDKYNSIQLFLNPVFGDAIKVAELLLEIDNSIVNR